MQPPQKPNGRNQTQQEWFRIIIIEVPIEDDLQHAAHISSKLRQTDV